MVGRRNGARTEALSAVLAGRYGAVREQFAEHFADPLFRPVTDLDRPAHRRRTLEQLQALARGGGPRLGFPADYGGGGDMGAAVAAFQLLAFADLSLLVKAGVQWGLFGGAVQHLGTERHHRRYLPDIQSGALLGCFAMTETGHGSDVQRLRTTATFEPDTGEFVVSTPDEDARKDYIGNAACDATLAVVFAQLLTAGRSEGVHAFLVPIRAEPGGAPLPGVLVEDCGAKGGLEGVDNGRLTFDHVRVPREALLNRYGDVSPEGVYTSPVDDETKRFFVMVGTLVQGRISVAGGALSAAQLALTIAVRYGEQRRQFRAPGAAEDLVILDFLAHQRRLLPALASTYAFHFAQRHLVDELTRVTSAGVDPTSDEATKDRRRLESQAAGIKALGTWHAVATIQTCREACGGAGYLAENRLTQLRADTDVFTTFEGDNTVLLQLMAKGLLTEYRDEFGELDTLGTIRFVADHLVQAVLERSGVSQLTQRIAAVVPAESADVRDRGWHRDLFAWRAEHVVDSLARRIKRQVDDGTDLFAVFNSVQDHVLLAARASTEALILEAFGRAVDGCPDPAAADLLADCCALHALAVLERDRGWFLEHGRLTPQRSKAVTSAVDDLCARLRPTARTLVDAFAIPEAGIAAPIALGAEAERQRLRREAVDPLANR
jgi:acyl-CoA oxidase